MKQPHHILAVRIAHPVWTLFLLALVLAVDHTGIVRLGLLCSCLHECGHLLVWVLLANLPFMVIQRYNRPRLVRLAALLRKREQKKGDTSARTDTDL